MGSALEDVADVEHVGCVDDVVFCFVDVVERVYAAESAEVIFVAVDDDVVAVEAAGRGG